MTTAPIFCALDTADPTKAAKLAQAVGPFLSGIKLGLEFFCANGPAGLAVANPEQRPLFLDLKLHDIPNTVAGALTSLLPLQPTFLTVHTAGGATMMQAARQAAEAAGETRPKLLGVTVLTSLDGDDLAAVGQDRNSTAQVLRLAQLALASGLDGLVCAAREVQTLRQALGPEVVLMVPGIRPSWASANDQKRVMTPREALAAGASHLVIGRPITTATDPALAARKIYEEIQSDS